MDKKAASQAVARSVSARAEKIRFEHGMHTRQRRPALPLQATAAEDPVAAYFFAAAAVVNQLEKK